jgi:hypothetical protein
MLARWRLCVYLAIVAILSVVGFFAAWKRNPMYSAGQTLRIVAGMGLGIAAMVALDILSVRLTMDRSPWIFGPTMGCFVLVSVFGMFLIARGFTTPKQKPLPAGVPLVDVNRRKVWVWAKRAGWAVAGFGLLGLLLPFPFQVMAYLLAGFCAFLAAFMMPIGYIAARDQDRALTGVETEPWVRWSYSEAEWQQITQGEMVRAGLAATPNFSFRRQWKLLLGLAIFMVVFAKFIGYTWLWAFVFLAGVAALMGLILWYGKRDALIAPARKQKSMAREPRNAYFAEGGLFWEGDFCPWLSMNMYLVRAGLEGGGPQSLVLHFEKVLPGQGGPSIVPVEQRVPVPAGREDDVRLLQEKLSELCPKASVAICQAA